MTSSSIDIKQMDFDLQASLATGSWTDDVRDHYSSYMLEDETVSIYLEDRSNYFSNEDVEDMKNIIFAIDESIDLDFEFTNDPSSSDIDIFLGDSTYQDYMGQATLKDSWIKLEVLGDKSTSRENNMNTFTHEFLHALGIGEPGHNTSWNQDDTVMSYNPGNFIDWRTLPGDADYYALTSIWGHENDSAVFSSNANPGQAPLPPGDLDLDDHLFETRLPSSDAVNSLSGRPKFLLALMRGNDFLEVTGGSNNISDGNNGEDHTVLSGGQSRYFGSAENDRLDVFGAEAGNWANRSGGMDTVTGRVNGLTYRGGSEKDTLQVSAGTVWGDQGADTFQIVTGGGDAVFKDYTAGEYFVQGIAGGSFRVTDQGLSYGVGNDHMLLLQNINDASQVTLI